jgi:hypothetical protein
VVVQHWFFEWLWSKIKIQGSFKRILTFQIFREVSFYLNFKSSLESWSEESSKWTNNRAEEAQSQRMEHEWIHCKGSLKVTLKFKLVNHFQIEVKYNLQLWMRSLAVGTRNLARTP